MGTADAYEPWSSDGARGSAANEPYELRRSRSSSRIIRANSTFIQLNHRLGATLALLRLLRCF